MTDSQRLIGIEIGGTKLQAVSGHADGRINRTVREPARRADGAQAILSQVQRMIEALLADGPVRAVGIGFGGPVDEVAGRVVKSHHVAGWEGFALADWVRDTFDRPCRLGNDTDAAALAEATLGAGRGRACTFYTNIGSGIGGGLVRDGRLYTGRHGAMEFGHTWSYSPLLGRWERVEHLCSGWAIQRRARDGLADHPTGPLFDLCDGQPDRIDAALVARAWQQGDPTATRLMDDVIDSLSHALCTVIALLNPDIIVIGGGVALIGPPLFDALTRAVHQHVFEPFADNFTIAPATLAETAVPAGALLLAANA